MDDLHLRKIDTKEKEKVLSFVSSDVANCLYLFLDIEMYDLAGDTIDVWLQECENSTIVSVIMRYEDSFQLYCRETDLAKVEFESIATLLRSFDPMRISAPVGMIRGLYAYFSDDYEDSYGSIIALKKYRKFEDDNIKIEKATIDDMPEVVNLIMLDDELGQSYDYSSMVRQFQDRIKDGLLRQASGML